MPSTAEGVARNVYKLDSPNVYIDNVIQNIVGTTIFSNVGDTIRVEATLVDANGSPQTQIDQTALGYPPALKVPVVKMVGGARGTAVDEVYLTVILKNGVLIVSGSLPASGNWKLLESRINSSLKAIGADWELEIGDYNILV